MSALAKITVCLWKLSVCSVNTRNMHFIFDDRNEYFAWIHSFVVVHQKQAAIVIGNEWMWLNIDSLSDVFYIHQSSAFGLHIFCIENVYNFHPAPYASNSFEVSNFFCGLSVSCLVLVSYAQLHTAHNILIIVAVLLHRKIESWENKTEEGDDVDRERLTTFKIARHCECDWWTKLKYNTYTAFYTS